METAAATFYCGYCGEPNHTFVDLSQGREQSYIEDCQVCCRPNLLHVSADPVSGDVAISAQFEG